MTNQDAPDESALLPTPPILYHYTDWAGFEGMLKSKDLWATHHTALNDREEIDYARLLLREFVRPFGHETPQKAKAVLEAEHPVSESAHGNTCVASFSEEGDLLSQWRAYAERGCGLCLGFDARRLRELQVSPSAAGHPALRRVVYAPGEQVRELRDWLLDTEKDARSFLDLAYRFKNPHFYEEREWRLVCQVGSAARPDVRIGRNGPVAYVRLSFMAESSIIKSITTGPGCHDHRKELASGISALLAHYFTPDTKPDIYHSSASLKDGR